MKEIDEKILNFIGNNSETTTSVCEELDLNRSTAHRKLNSLLRFNFLDVNKNKQPFKWSRK